MPQNGSVFNYVLEITKWKEPQESRKMTLFYRHRRFFRIPQTIPFQMKWKERNPRKAGKSLCFQFTCVFFFPRPSAPAIQLGPLVCMAPLVARWRQSAGSRGRLPPRVCQHLVEVRRRSLNTALPGQRQLQERACIGALRCDFGWVLDRLPKTLTLQFSNSGHGRPHRPTSNIHELVKEDFPRINRTREILQCRRTCNCNDKYMANGLWVHGRPQLASATSSCPFIPPTQKAAQKMHANAAAGSMQIGKGGSARTNNTRGKRFEKVEKIHRFTACDTSEVEGWAS